MGVNLGGYEADVTKYLKLRTVYLASALATPCAKE
jgi:hypothetical protein